MEPAFPEPAWVRFQSPFGDGRFLTLIIIPNRLHAKASSFQSPFGDGRFLTFEDGRVFDPTKARVSIPFRRWPLSNPERKSIDRLRRPRLFQSPFGDGRFLTVLASACGCEADWWLFQSPFGDGRFLTTCSPSLPTRDLVTSSFNPLSEMAAF